MAQMLPVEIAHQEFPKAWRGYARREVEVFRQQVEAALEEALSENRRWQQEVEELRRQLEGYRSMEETLKEALVLAERSAEERREQGMREAHQIVERARREAEEIVREARGQVERYRAESEHLLRLRSRFEAEFMGLLTTYRHMLQGNGVMAGKRELEGGEEIVESALEERPMEMESAESGSAPETG